MYSDPTYPASHTFDQMGGWVVTKMVMFETGTYNDMVVRPYQSNVTHQSLNMFHEITQNGSDTSPTAMGALAGHILRPNSQFEATISVPNGWAERRFSFLMEVRSRAGTVGRGLRFILTGYTDSVAISIQSHAVDPNMMLYINNAFTMRESISRHPTSGEMVSRNVWMADASQIMSPVLREQLYIPSQPHYNPGDQLRTMRPEDVFSSLARATHLNRYLEMGYQVHDDVGTLRQGISKSTRLNNSAATWLNKALQAQSQASLTHRNDSREEMLSSARSMAMEQPISSDMVLQALCGCTDLRHRGGLTWGELNLFSPETDGNTLIVTRGEMHKNSIGMPGLGRHLRNETEQWTGNDMPTVIATTLANAVPALMTDNLLTWMMFAVTNKTVDGSFLIEFPQDPRLQPKSFVENLDLRIFLETFMIRLQHEILPGLTSNKLIPISFDMTVDVMTETRINVMFGDDTQPIPFVIPSFCDAAIAPILTTQGNNLYGLADDIEKLAPLSY